MAISFQNNPFLNTFGNPFTNDTLNNLKPYIKQSKQETSENKVKENEENKEIKTIKNPIDTLRSSLTNKVLGGLLSFGLQNARNNATNLQNLRQLPNEMKPKEEQNALKNSLKLDNLLDTPETIITNNTNKKETDSSILDKLKFLNGDKLSHELQGEMNLVSANSIEVRESITYSISYDSASGQYSQSIAYSSSFVANFNSEITDKNGNTFISQTQLVMGKSFESQITGGVESVNEALKGFLEGQKFALEYDGELDEESFKNNGLDNMLLIIDSNNNAIANAFNEVLNQNQNNDFGKIFGRGDDELMMVFESLHNILSSSLEIFLGITQNPNNQNSHSLNNIKGFSSREFNLNITTAKIGIQNADIQNEQQWKAKKMDIESLEILSYSSVSFSASSFTFNA